MCFCPAAPSFVYKVDQDILFCDDIFFSNLHSELDGLRQVINEKNAIIDDVNRQRDEARWSLGEHQQWLTDANNR